jgi:3-hydroxyacyl-CoA dehydrogenase
VAILGAGTMGASIAMACANAGLRVSLSDGSTEALTRGFSTIKRSYQSSVDRGRLTAAAAAERFARIRSVSGYEGCASADLVIEAVYENMTIKKEVFGEIGRRARPGAILASNTSTLDIDQLGAVSGVPESVIGLHFFSPAHVMRLVEIVRGVATGKVSSRLRSSSRSASPRWAWSCETRRASSATASCSRTCTRRSSWPRKAPRRSRWTRCSRTSAWRWGIFAVDDMGGLDVAWRIRKELRQFEGEDGRKPLVADLLVELGRLGQKVRKGWYRYGDDRKPIPDPEVMALVESVARANRVERRSISREEILERTIYALVNEGARVLGEGVAQACRDIDVIYLNGYGFPAFRGGPLYYADTVGLGKIHERLLALERDHGPRFEPAPLLARLAREGSSFASTTGGSRRRRRSRELERARDRAARAAGERRGSRHRRAPRGGRRPLPAVAARARALPEADHRTARALGRARRRSRFPGAARRRPSAGARSLTPRRSRPCGGSRPRSSSGGSRPSGRS